MPSAELCPIPKMSAPVNNTNFNISISSAVEGLVLEIKENLRLSGPSLKAKPFHHLSRKSSRASPYRMPGKYVCDSFDANCVRHANKQKKDLAQKNPYDLLQDLLRSEKLISEAVRRIQMGLTSKKFYHDSDEESPKSPVFRLYQDN